MRRCVRLLSLAAALAACATPARADDAYPSRPIRLVVPYGAGAPPT